MSFVGNILTRKCPLDEVYVGGNVPVPTRQTSTQLIKDKTSRNYNYDKVDFIYCLKNLFQDFSNLVSQVLDAFDLE